MFAQFLSALFALIFLMVVFAVVIFCVSVLIIGVAEVYYRGRYRPGKSIIKTWREAISTRGHDFDEFNGIGCENKSHEVWKIPSMGEICLEQSVYQLDQECYRQAWSFERVEAYLSNGHYLIMRAFEKPTEITGYLLYRDELNARDSEVEIVRIMRLGVKADKRGIGHGKSLFYALLSKHSSNKRILIEIPIDGNEEQALQFLRTLGFRETIRDPRDKEATKSGSVTMELDRHGNHNVHDSYFD